MLRAPIASSNTTIFSALPFGRKRQRRNGRLPPSSHSPHGQPVLFEARTYKFGVVLRELMGRAGRISICPAKNKHKRYALACQKSSASARARPAGLANSV